MGHWGAGILENDTSCDVKAAFERHLEAGLSTAGAVGAVYDEFRELMKDRDARPDVILALAWVAGALGRVPVRVAKDAVSILESGEGLSRWEGSPEYEARITAEQVLLGILQGTIPHPDPKKKSPKSHRPSVGDVIEIPLSIGQHAYARYVHHHRKYGSMIEVYQLIAAFAPPLHEVIASGTRFPPIFVPVRAALESWGWPVVGHVPVKEFVFPIFADRVRNGWWLTDEYQQRRVETLPETIKEPEPLVIWGHDHLIRRIETGQHDFNRS